MLLAFIFDLIKSEQTLKLANHCDLFLLRKLLSYCKQFSIEYIVEALKYIFAGLCFCLSFIITKFLL